MSRVFALGDDAVMTTETGPDDRRVVNPCRCPVTGAMAVFTGRGRQYVSRIFPLGDHTIMTTDAITGDTHMIVAGTHPGDRIVTVIADIRTHDMLWMFTFGDHAVVATLTASDHSNVVNSKHVGPYRGRVTDLAFTDDAYMLAGWGAGFYPT